MNIINLLQDLSNRKEILEIQIKNKNGRDFSSHFCNL